MKTLEELKAMRAEMKRKLRAAYDAAARRGAIIVISDEERERFEEACRPRPSSHVDASVAKNTWVRC